MSEGSKKWFKEFETYCKVSFEKSDSYFLKQGSERLRAYGVISELEKLVARLWGIMRIQEEEARLGRRSKKNVV